MKAITLKQNGGIENLTFEEISTPAILRNEVLIEVKALSINPVDIFVRKDKNALDNIINPKPGEKVILGWDLSGTIVEKGKDVRGFEVGDDVFGMINYKGHGKAYAEYVAAPANHLAKKPINTVHTEAAAATLAALTAWQGLAYYGKIQKGNKVIIHAAAGGVGHYAVQIAKHLGAYVIATGSSVNKDFISSLGADEFIDYQKESFEEKINDADVVLDSIPGDHLLKSVQALKKGGRLISIFSYFNGEVSDKAKEKNLVTCRISVQSDGEDIKKISNLLEQGVLKSHVFATYKFADLPKAHQQVETRKTRGKVVIAV